MLQLLAQTADDYVYTYQTSSTNPSVPPVLIAIYLAVAVLMVVSMWKVYQKAGKPGWAAIVPFYNIWVQLQIVGKPTWWFFLFFVPIANIVVSILVLVELAKVFAKGGGFVALLFFLPFIAYPMLAFGKAQYHAPAASGSGAASGPAVATPPAAVSETPASSTPDAPTDTPKQPPVV